MTFEFERTSADREPAATAAGEVALAPMAARRSRFRAWSSTTLAIVLLSFLGWWFADSVLRAREAARASQCRGHLKGLAVALHSYADTYGSFPPPYIADENGRPLHSWRVLLLPFIDQQKLYEQYRFDEPWDGPNNRKLHAATIALYNCPTRFSPGEESPITSYLAVVGPGTMWPETGLVRLEDVAGSADSTLMVVEVENSDVHWMEPRDLHVQQMAPTVNSKAGQGISSPHYDGEGANAAMADGAVQILKKGARGLGRQGAR